MFCVDQGGAGHTGTACITIPDHKCGRKVRHVRRARSLTRSLCSLSAGGSREGGGCTHFPEHRV